MQSSPGTPTGTGCRWRSSSRILEFAIGLPIGGSAGHCSGAPVSGYAVATWLSVGPYWLTSVASGCRLKKLRSSSVTFNCSPAVMTLRSAGTAVPRYPAAVAEVVQSDEREKEPLDPLFVDEREERSGVAPLLVADQDERAAGAPGREQLLERDVEAQRGELQRAGRRRLRLGPRVELPGEQVRERPVRHRDPFRPAGRARGVDDVREVVERRAAVESLFVLNRDLGPAGVEADRLGVVGRQPVEQALLRQENGSACIGEHERDSLFGVVRIDRGVRTARLERPEHADQLLRRTLGADRDDRARSDSQAAQVVRELIGARVELRVGQYLAVERDGGSLRSRARLLGEQLVHRPKRGPPDSGRAVSFHSCRTTRRSFSPRSCSSLTGAAGSSSAAASRTP